MKIYDCFTFFNELELLELRLKILDKYVDHFVIVEMDKTHAGKSKRFIFEENKKRFSKYMKKIIYIKAKSPELNKFYKSKFFDKINKIKFFSVLINRFNLGRWKLELFQRNQISQGLNNLKKEDIVIVSDLDEIPNPKKFEEMKDYLGKNEGIIGFQQNLYAFFLNGFIHSNWVGTKATSYEYFCNILKKSAQKLRIQRNIFLSQTSKNLKIIKNGGWHFTYLGNLDKLVEKMNSVSEGLQNTSSRGRGYVQKMIDHGKFFDTGRKIKYQKSLEDLPDEIKKNPSKWKHLIKKE